MCQSMIEVLFWLSHHQEIFISLSVCLFGWCFCAITSQPNVHFPLHSFSHSVTCWPASHTHPLSHSIEHYSAVLVCARMQDYHRFHFLTGATLSSITNVPGRLYTVNPIAINSPFANVLTQNKRAVCMYDTPEYGPVAFVVIGATMVSTFLLRTFCSIASTAPIPSQHCYCHSANAARAMLLSQHCYLSRVMLYTM